MGCIDDHLMRISRKHQIYIYCDCQCHRLDDTCDVVQSHTTSAKFLNLLLCCFCNWESFRVCSLQ